MTTFPSITPKTSNSGTVLACLAFGLVAALMLSVDMQGAAGFRTGADLPVIGTAPVQTRASNALAVFDADAQAGFSATRARN